MTKIGGDPRPAPRSPYDEGCIAAHALDLLGDRWARLVIRQLLLGPKRFSVIRAGLPGISATILTRRLQDLAAVYGPQPLAGWQVGFAGDPLAGQRSPVSSACAAAAERPWSSAPRPPSRHTARSSLVARWIRLSDDRTPVISPIWSRMPSRTAVDGAAICNRRSTLPLVV